MTLTFLDKVKYALRVDGTEFDVEIQDLIDEAKALLNEAGILESKIVDTDPLIRKAVITYCKSAFGTDTKDAERFAWSFEEMKKLLSLLSSYTVEVIV